MHEALSQLEEIRDNGLGVAICLHAMSHGGHVIANPWSTTTLLSARSCHLRVVVLLMVPQPQQKSSIFGGSRPI